MASAEQEVCLQPTDQMIVLWQAHRATQEKQKCIFKREITTKERNKFQNLSKKTNKRTTTTTKNQNHINLSLGSSTAQHLLRWDIIAHTLGGCESAFPDLSRGYWHNCAAWHIPCSASLLPSSLFQPVFSFANIFKYYLTPFPLGMPWWIAETGGVH